MSDAKPDLKRDGTMQLGSKEDETVETDALNKPDEDIKIAEDHVDEEDKCEEPSAKKARLSKDMTMVDTIKAGKEFLANEKLGESRSETSARREKPPSAKRVSTMTKTALEGEELLKREGHADSPAETGRRTTRSQTRGGSTPSPAKPPAKRSSSTPSTPKDGSDSQKRGRKGRPKKAEKKDDDEEKESAEEVSTEETKDETDEVKEENKEAQEAEVHEVDEQQQDGTEEESAEQTPEKTI